MPPGRGVFAALTRRGGGPLAGPVVTAAVILDPANVPVGLDDSKKLSAARREELFAEITASAMVAIAVAPPTLIAVFNIRGATLWAMRQAVLNLAVPPDHVLIDGRDLPPRLPARGQAIIGGDGLSASIAAASIVAKVTRDAMCAIMDCDAPQFGFAGHKGYSSARHLQVLSEHGPCRHHREDFAPVVAARVRLLVLDA